MRSVIEDILANLVKEGKVTPVQHSEWASPVVIVRKKDGSFRMCADFKRTLNPRIWCDFYPLPKPEEVFASLAGGRVFVTHDLADAYAQFKFCWGRNVVYETICGCRL